MWVDGGNSESERLRFRPSRCQALGLSAAGTAGGADGIEASAPMAMAYIKPLVEIEHGCHAVPPSGWRLVDDRLIAHDSVRGQEGVWWVDAGKGEVWREEHTRLGAKRTIPPIFPTHRAAPPPRRGRLGGGARAPICGPAVPLPDPPRKGEGDDWNASVAR